MHQDAVKKGYLALIATAQLVKVYLRDGQTWGKSGQEVYRVCLAW